MLNSGLTYSVWSNRLIRSRLFRIRRIHSSVAQLSYPKPKTSASANTHRSVEDRCRLRNVGIIAHINAGKTTTTERFLYLAGTTCTAGDVDKGNTVTDYLVQERDRGITITSAAVSFDWHKHRINLIDTPGHVDFTFEVERSLSVLDGAITLLDASAGVEAQTLTVWNQAKRYRLSNIIFLNKCDKPQADHEMCVDDLRRDLEIDASLIQLPIKSALSGSGLSIVDIINRTHLVWIKPEDNYGTEFVARQLFDCDEPKGLDKKVEHKVEELRERLIYKLADFDEEFATHVIECDKVGNVSAERIDRALRNCVVAGQVCPVLVGSSFKYIGVQPLLDAIVKYLPSPAERLGQVERSLLFDGPQRRLAESSKSAKSKQLNSAYVFKITHDKRLGPLCYVRVTSGTLEKMQRFKDLESSQAEQVKKVYRVFADELREIVTPVTRDDIVVVSGLSHTRTGNLLIDTHYKSIEARGKASPQIDELEGGDTGTLAGQVSSGFDYVDSNAVAGENNIEEEEEESESINADNGDYKANTGDKEEAANGVAAGATSAMPFRVLEQNILVPRIGRVEPVYYSSIESQSQSQQIRLEKALAMVAREDSSFSFDINALGVTTIRGMGKLHLEIIRDRLRSEHGVGALLGPIQISYRETIGSCATDELNVDRLVNSVRSAISIRLSVRPKPGAGVWSPKELRLEQTTGAFVDSSAGGGGGGDWRLRTDHRRAIANGLKSALQHGPLLGHPVIDCEIVLLAFQANKRSSLPMVASVASQCLTGALARAAPVLLEPIMHLEVNVPQEHNGTVLSDLASNRRGQILSTVARASGAMVQLRSRAPLANLADYSEFLRTATSGRATFTMRLDSYQAMSESERMSLARS